MFLTSIQLLSMSFIYLSEGIIAVIINATSNPIIGLFIGLLATSILQSSSTTTSIVIAAVASGSLTLENTIPIVIGANIGTTITSTIISMSYLNKTKEFKRAVAAGTVHDIFNILLVIMIFPLEIKYGFLSNSCQYLASLIHMQSGSVVEISVQSSLLSEFVSTIGQAIHPLILPIVAMVGIFGSVKLISNFLYKELIGKSKERFETIVFRTPIKSFSWGLILTAIIQSSSISTSLIVPIVATRKVKLKTAFQFIIGANLGTTLTAIIAATFKSEAAIALAFVHFLFNLIGVIIFLAVPGLRKLPVILAKKLGRVSMKYRFASIVYILFTFFILPFTLIYLNGKFSEISQPPSKKTETIETKK